MGSAYASILLLMSNFLVVALFFPSGSAICFPVALFVKKEIVGLLNQLKGGVVDNDVWRIAQERAVTKKAVGVWRRRVASDRDLVGEVAAPEQPAVKPQ